MSDDLDISAGGAVAVDTDTLRHAARGFDVLHADLDDVDRYLMLAADDLMVGPATSQRLGAEIDALRMRTAERRETAAEVARALRDAAAVYETVELWAERRAAELAGDDARAGLIQRRLTALHGDHPDAGIGAAMLLMRHTLTWPSDLVAQAHTTGALLSPFGAAGLFVGGLAASAHGTGAGRVPASARRCRRTTAVPAATTPRCDARPPTPGLR